ncbi:MAG TPA: TlpA disulfide reductase family protein [Kineosporiaceae bacterium]
MSRATRVAALALAGVVGLGGCSSSSAAGTNYVAGDGTVRLVAADERGAPVELRGTTLEGTPVDVGSYRGKIVVLNVWGSWCPPCRKEAPELQAAAQRLGPQGVQFVGIDTSDPDPAQAIAFQKTFGVTYPSISDPTGDALLALRGAVPPNAIPTTLVLDRQGRVAARISSATTATTLADLVSDVVAGKDTR